MEQNWLDSVIVTAAQMQAIEALMFEAGMPIAALMEKVAGLIVQRFEQLYPASIYPKVGVLVGPGHNGGDALVVARELWHRGRQVYLHVPVEPSKPLTGNHLTYLQNLGVSALDLEELRACDVLIDGLFGCGLGRELTGTVATVIDTVNSWSIPILSIDLPSGLATDTGGVLGTAVRATHTLCLGLWKRGVLSDTAISLIGKLEIINFDIPAHIAQSVLGSNHVWWRIDPAIALTKLKEPRPLTVHKYQMGHLLLIAGSRRFGGAAFLTALGARATGIGMLSIAVPESLQAAVLARLPEALIITCPETDTGAIAALPSLEIEKYSAIACGPGLTVDALSVVEPILSAPRPLVIDADGLNILAQLGIDRLSERSHPTILTPHWGEFCRLFPDLIPNLKNESDRLAVLEAALIHCSSPTDLPTDSPTDLSTDLPTNQAHTTILLKGARTAIGFATNSGHQIWINPASTPALARGGSGDVLTGIIGGLLAQNLPADRAAIIGAVWHAQAALQLAQQLTERGVHPVALAENLLPTLHC